MKKLLGIVIVVLFLIVGLPFSCQYMEEPNRYFATYTEDLHKGLWVPDIFPKDIKEIYEQHNIDTDEVWLRFKIGSKKIDLSHYSILSEQQKNNIEFHEPFMASWWFKSVIEQQPANNSILYLNVYKGSCGENRVSYIAIPKSSKTHDYYWWCQIK